MKIESIGLRFLVGFALCTFVACGDSDSSSDPTSNSTTSNGTSAASNATSNSTSNQTTSNGTTAASNGTSTSNGTTVASNGTTGTSNGTTATSNGTTATSNGTNTSNGTTDPEPTPVEPSGIGVVGGTVITAPPPGGGGGFQPAGNIAIALQGGPDMARIEMLTMEDGRWMFPNVPGGYYTISASSDTGASSSLDIEVDDGVGTRINFALIFPPPNFEPTLLASYTASLFAKDGPNPDANGNGIVDAEDRAVVRERAAVDDSTPDLDLDGNGAIDADDIAMVDAHFGKVILLSDTLYQAVGPAEASLVQVSEGDMTPLGRVEGETTGRLTFNNAEDSSDAFFAFEQADGQIIVDGMGGIPFTGVPGNSGLGIDLNMSKVTGGFMEVMLNGEGGQGVVIPADVGEGFIAIRPGGFDRAYFVSVQAVFPDVSPIFAGTSVLAAGACDSKDNKACDEEDSRMGSRNSCTWGSGGSGTCRGGPTCTSEGADCASGGSCGTCQTNCHRRFGGYVLCSCGCK